MTLREQLDEIERLYQKATPDSSGHINGFARATLTDALVNAFPALRDAALQVGEIADELSQSEKARAYWLERNQTLGHKLDNTARSLAEAERELVLLRANLSDANYWRKRHNRESEAANKRSNENWQKWKNAERSLAEMRDACAKACESLMAPSVTVSRNMGIPPALMSLRNEVLQTAVELIRALPDAAGGAAPIRARTETEWIPVSERLPDDDKDGAQVIGCFTYEGGSQMVGAISVTKLLAGKLDRVTSWQPLPAPPAPIRARTETEWIPVAERLPEVGDWANVLIDHETADWSHRKYHTGSRYEVACARLRSIDKEGNPDWEQGRLASGHPLMVVSYVTKWQPLPSVMPAVPRAAHETVIVTKLMETYCSVCHKVTPCRIEDDCVVCMMCGCVVHRIEEDNR